MHVDADPLKNFTYYTIDFTSANWFMPVRVLVSARPDAAWEDPQNAVITFVRDDLQATNLLVLKADGTVDVAKSDIDNGKTSDPLLRYVFPNIRSGTGTTSIEVIDDETADMISIESGLGTLVQKCNIASPGCTLPGTGDWYTIRLTKRPTGDVDVAVLTDGMVDVVAIDGNPITPADYQVIGGLVPTRLFVGNLAVSSDGLTITRANGSDLGSFVDEGFERGYLIRITINGVDYQRRDRRHAARRHRAHDHARDGAPEHASGTTSAR